MKRFLSCLVLGAISSVAAAQSPLTSTFAGNVNLPVSTIYFDLTVTAPLAILRIDCNINSPVNSQGALHVFTLPNGSIAGNMLSTANWTGPGVVGDPIVAFGLDVPSPCNLTTPLQLPVGTHGMAITVTGLMQAVTQQPSSQPFSTAEMSFGAGNADFVPFTGGTLQPIVPNLRIHYSAGTPGTVLATNTNYGAGCLQQTGTSFYENFPTGAFDLTGSVDNMTLVNTGTGYHAMTAVPGVTYAPPSNSAQVLALFDDSDVPVTLSTPMPVGFDRTTTVLQVCSNGFISTGPNGVSFVPSPSVMLSNVETAWYSWHDYNPSAGGGGQVKFEEVAGIAFVTWDGVFTFGQTTPRTIQFQFELATGNVSILWHSMPNAIGNHLIGFSEGGPSSDPGSIDLSVLLPMTIQNAATFEIVPLTFDANARPIINTPIGLVTSNLSPGTLLGGVFFGLSALSPPVNLASIGMAGCFQHTDQLGSILFFPTAASAATIPFTVPNLVGLDVHVQSASYDPFGNSTTLGARTSNAIHLRVGDW